MFPPENLSPQKAKTKAEEQKAKQSPTMAEENGWYTRKRKAPQLGGGASASTNSSGEKEGAQLAVPSSTSPAETSSSASGIPESLLPFLGWTKLSACHRPRSKKRRNNNWNRDEALQKVTGRAIFFIHDPRPEDGQSDEKDESKIWFQGRFFPSIGLGGKSSPTSVSSDRIAPTSSSIMNQSWGLLAVQNEVIDECLTCSEGGYRELDLTFIRNKPSPSFSYRKKERKVRWVAQDVVWTGGNMMNLSSDPYTSPSAASLRVDEPGVKFEPQKLLEGKRAMDIAAKYFPSMVKRLQIHNVTNESFEEGCLLNDDDAMVLIGDMEVVAPVSFVRVGGGFGGFHGGDSDDDELWND